MRAAAVTGGPVVVATLPVAGAATRRRAPRRDGHRFRRQRAGRAPGVFRIPDCPRGAAGARSPGGRADAEHANTHAASRLHGASPRRPEPRALTGGSPGTPGVSDVLRLDEYPDGAKLGELKTEAGIDKRDPPRHSQAFSAALRRADWERRRHRAANRWYPPRAV